MKRLLFFVASLALAAACGKVDYNALPTPVPEAVDLGLSVKWASCNLGASQPWDDGYYYAWGTVAPQARYEKESYTEVADDAAYKRLGAGWSIPTEAQWDELLDKANCEWKWTSYSFDASGARIQTKADEVVEETTATVVVQEVKPDKVVWGMEVISRKNGASIFLPAAGYRSGESRFGESVERGKDEAVGRYWSCDAQSDDLSNAIYLMFSGSGAGKSAIKRYFGMSIRAVSTD